RIAPKISHSGESHKDRAEAHEITARPGLTEGLQSRHNDIFANFLHPRVIQSPARHDSGAEIFRHHVRYGDETLGECEPLRMFHIDGLPLLAAMAFEIRSDLKSLSALL